ncbi:septum site-determining protein Ssd [Pseudonocardia acaciae]|uniref:septum site-determining protein Ssd n=1 Tax=Pseudonocardia acaciae TaxID=551276 RepID=UPI000A03C9F8|nr:septum site-determining protein Ssd [Pseudonocardia acaciae]
MEQPRALVLVADGELLDDVLRLAAAAGCELERVPDASAARLRWASAPLVLLDEPAAQNCARAGLARRPRVVVVSRGQTADGLWQHAVAIGAEQVVELPDGEAWLVSALADAAEGVSNRGRVLAVVGGRGGAGASVLAAAVAVTGVADGERAMLVDCDPLGGGLDLLLGAEEVRGLRWPDLALSEGRVPAASLRSALPIPAVGGGGAGELTLLSCDRSGSGPRPGAVASVLDAGRRAGETVVCDLPRYPTEAALAALDNADLSVLVVPAEVRSTAAAARVASVLSQRGAPVRLVVRGPAPGGLSPRDVAGALGLPLLHAMRPQPGLARALDRGTPPGAGRGPLAVAARAVLDELHSQTRAEGSG